MSKYHSKDILHFTELTLLIRDFKRSLEFYVDILGFTLLNKESHLAILSANQIDPLITLIEDRNAIPIDFNLGLYHFALLLPTQIEFAKMIKNLSKKHYPVSGMSDHGVSEAIYLDDPDGNGIEIYCDKPESEWLNENDQLAMVTKELDFNGVMSELSSNDVFDKIPSNTLLGHLHFYVSNLDEAKLFYADALGFALTMTYMDTALFLSASKYHHHLGLNTWNGHAPINKKRQVGLKSYVLNVPKNQHRDLMRRLANAHIPILVENGQKYILDILNQKIFIKAQEKIAEV